MNAATAKDVIEIIELRSDISVVEDAESAIKIAKWALGKQISQKAVKWKNGNQSCSNCNHELILGASFCCNCGQALKWSD